MVNIILIHKRETKNKKLTEKNQKTKKETRNLAVNSSENIFNNFYKRKFVSWHHSASSLPSNSKFVKNAQIHRELYRVVPFWIWTIKQVLKAKGNTFKAKTTCLFHALQMDLVSQQMGLGLISCVCIIN